MNYKARRRLLLFLLCMLWLCACTSKQALEDDQQSSENTQVTYAEDDFYLDFDQKDVNEIDLDQKQGEVKITNAGTYVLHGSLQGSLSIDVGEQETVRLVLKEASITSSSGPAIRCNNGKKLIISLYQDTTNQLIDAANTADSEADATISVQNDLTVNGSGSLSIQANIQNAIKAKDTLKLMDGSLQIKSVDNGIIGKDALYIHEGSYQIEASGDAIKSTYDKDDEKGDIIIENGSFELTAAQDGIQAARNLTIYNGNFQIEAGGGSTNAVKTNNAFQHGSFPQREQTNSEEETISTKGIKATGTLIIKDGVFTLNTCDDSLHANGDITLTNGSFTITSGDDGIHADDTLTIDNGSINITESYEGLEGADVIINDGDIQIVSDDDGINAAGGSDQDSAAEPFIDHFRQGGDYTIQIHGGTVLVDAKGDGLDSNGTIEMDGGSVVVFGPSDGGNGALDYEEAFKINGGILIAAGSSQMAQAPSSDSSQNAVMFNISQQEANTLFYLCDASGNPIIAAAPSRTYDNIVISTPKLTLQKEYQLYIGGSGTENDAGYMESGFSGGTLLTAITLTDTITQYGQGGMNMPGNREKGNGRGDMPPGEQFPSERKDFDSPMDQAPEEAQM